MTGLKSVDKLIEKYGVNAFAQDTPFMRRQQYVQSDAIHCGLPFCFYREIERLNGGEALWCFTVSLPDKKQKLAAFLVNSNKDIIEQVYYPRDHRGVKACDKIKRLLAKSLKDYKDEEYKLAA